MPRFCSQEALLVVTAEAVTQAKVFTMSSTGCKDTLATKQPSVTNAQNSSHKASSSWSVNSDMLSS